jgi:hypothetical protein
MMNKIGARHLPGNENERRHPPDAWNMAQQFKEKHSLFSIGLRECGA